MSNVKTRIDHQMPLSSTCSSHKGLEGQLSLSSDRRTVTKTAYPDTRHKVLREARWIQDLPPDLRARFPEVLTVSDAEAQYTMKAIPAPSVSEVLSAGRITPREAIASGGIATMRFLVTEGLNSRRFRQIGNISTCKRQ